MVWLRALISLGIFIMPALLPSNELEVQSSAHASKSPLLLLRVNPGSVSAVSMISKAAEPWAVATEQAHLPIKKQPYSVFHAGLLD